MDFLYDDEQDALREARRHQFLTLVPLLEASLEAAAQA